MRLQIASVSLLIVALNFSVWTNNEAIATNSSSYLKARSQGQVDKPGSSESQSDRVVFRIGVLGEVVTEGFYATSGRKIDVTYEEAPNLTVALTLGNLGPRPIRIVWPDGKTWLDHVSFEVHQGLDLAQVDSQASWDDLFKTTKLVARTFRIKERSVERTQYFKDGVIISPSDYQFDPNSGYRPKEGLFDDYKTIRETVREFPTILEQRSYVEVRLELVDDNSQRLPSGIYWIRATIDLKAFGLNLPPSHRNSLTDISGPWEIRRITTAEDRVGYHWIQARYFFREKNILAAEQELLTATSENPDSTRAWWYLAHWYEEYQKDYDKAIGAYQRLKAVSEKKKLTPPEDPNRPRMKDVNGRLLFDEPAYRPGTIERLQQKKAGK